MRSVHSMSTGATQGEAVDGSIAICVASYLRPQGLERLLWAIAGSELPDPAPRIEIVVVDNDSNRSAEAVCEALRDRYPFEIHYVVEKRRGISQARNAGLAVAISEFEFAVMTDDDVEPTPGWLAELIRVQRRCEADVVGGPNLPRFLDPPPDWVVEGRFFEGPRRMTGTPIEVAATHNVLIRCAALASMDTWFDEELSACGGEDSEFFLRVGHAGHRMVWADAAIVHECVPASRTTLRWLMQRAFRIANGLGGAQSRRLRGMTRFDVVSEAFRCLIRGGTGLATQWPRGRAARVTQLRLVVSGVGWLSGLSGFRYREYRSVHGR